MSEDKDTKSAREERLAAKLRENLRRRKSQGREMRHETRTSDAPDLPNSDAES